MSRQNRFRPRVEVLEDRRVPTLVLGLDGAGRLHSVVAPDNAQTADVTLTVQEDNTLMVAEGSTVYGTFPVAKNLTVSLGDNTAGFVNRLDLNNLTLRANVRVELGDMPGLNHFRLTTAAGGTGTLDGNYSVQGGDTGSEAVGFGEPGLTAVRTINITRSVRIDMGGGGQDPNLGLPDLVNTRGGTVDNPELNTILNVDGNFWVTGSTVLALRGRVGGNLISDSSAKPVGQAVALGNFGEPFEVGGNVILKTGDANDAIFLQAVVINGNTNIQTGEGDDFLVVTTEEIMDVGPTPTQLHGNLFVDMGEGNDTVTVAALQAPETRMHVLLGAGDDVFRFTEDALGHDVFVELASLLVDGGPGTDTYDDADNVFDFPVRLRNIEID
jgi:hypothetical protein